MADPVTRQGLLRRLLGPDGPSILDVAGPENLAASPRPLPPRRRLGRSKLIEICPVEAEGEVVALCPEGRERGQAAASWQRAAGRFAHRLDGGTKGRDGPTGAARLSIAPDGAGGLVAGRSVARRSPGATRRLVEAAGSGAAAARFGGVKAAGPADAACRPDPSCAPQPDSSCAPQIAAVATEAGAGYGAWAGKSPILAHRPVGCRGASEIAARDGARAILDAALAADAGPESRAAA